MAFQKSKMIINVLFHESTTQKVYNANRTTFANTTVTHPIIFYAFITILQINFLKKKRMV